MAQRTRGGAVLSRRLLAIGRSSMTALGEPKEQQTIPGGAGHFAGNRAKRTVVVTLILEAVIEHLHQDLAASKATHQKSTWLGQPVIPLGSTETSGGSSPSLRGPACECLRVAGAQVLILGDGGGPPAGSIAAITLALCPQMPGATS